VDPRTLERLTALFTLCACGPTLTSCSPTPSAPASTPAAASSASSAAYASNPADDEALTERLLTANGFQIVGINECGTIVVRLAGKQNDACAPPTPANMAVPAVSRERLLSALAQSGAASSACCPPVVVQKDHCIVRPTPPGPPASVADK
jgi:hypothetical protein